MVLVRTNRNSIDTATVAELIKDPKIGKAIQQAAEEVASLKLLDHFPSRRLADRVRHPV